MLRFRDLSNNFMFLFLENFLRIGQIGLRQTLAIHANVCFMVKHAFKTT